MLITCEECGHQVSDKADSCPQCGYPVFTVEKFNKPKTDVPTTPTMSQQENQWTPPPQRNYTPPVQPNPTSQRRYVQEKKKDSTLSIVAAVLSILVVTSIGGFIVGLIDIGINDKTKRHIGSYFAVIMFLMVAAVGYFTLRDARNEIETAFNEYNQAVDEYNQALIDFMNPDNPDGFMSGAESPIEPALPENSNETIGQRNATRSAKNYISMMPFSHSGLVAQLEFENYSAEDAIYGADNCGADWYEQAAKKAQVYLDMMAFSRDGLIEQLEFEGFTTEQAIFGVEAVGY